MLLDPVPVKKVPDPVPQQQDKPDEHGSDGGLKKLTESF
jgi:hypothetical protein